MRIAHIIPGSGGSFYCGNCLRDSELFKALRSQGNDAVKIPMYLPLFSHDAGRDMAPVFYGAVSLYLKQMYPALRKAPKWVDRLLNSRPVLGFAAGKAGSTRASGLEEMTISMLMGEEGQQKEELDEMISWLEDHFNPDIVHISNALLLGLARKLKERLKVPVVCSLQDEHIWVDPMDQGSRDKVWALMREKVRDIDMFIAVSDYYSAFMKERLQLGGERIRTLHLGVDPDDYHYQNATHKEMNIGFLSRLNKSNGLDILVDAFIILKKESGNEKTGLLLTGGQTGDDRAFIREQKQKLAAAGIDDSVEFIHDFDHSKRKEFLSRIRLLSVPVREGEAFGIYLIEAMACGIPVVQPDLGAFPEIIGNTGGGITYPGSNNPADLADALSGILSDQKRTDEMSIKAREGVIKGFNIRKISGELTGIYRELMAVKHKIAEYAG